MFLIDNRNSTNPYVNLAIEEYLIRHADCNGKEYLLLYVNEPCIVLGKNQSIYKEVNFEYLRNGQVKLARRITGGGTVYQDFGNLSFSFISKFSDEKVNNYRYFNKPVVEALRKAAIEAEMDARNNILCKGKKISGNAQFTDRKNIISHGTLLLNANLAELRAALKENDFTVETRAVGSVRSSVMNISEITSQFKTCAELAAYLAAELGAVEKYKFADSEWTAIEKLAAEKFNTFDWIYAKSPFTKVIKKEIELEIENGTISSVKSEKYSFSQLVGTRYQFEEVSKVTGKELSPEIM